MSTTSPETSPTRSVITLSSSRFAAAMGISPYQSRAELWRILTKRKKPKDRNQSMAWGTHNEWRAVAAVEACTGLLFDYTGERQKKITWPCGTLAATPDGIVGGDIGLEVKCPEKAYEAIPHHYMPQMQGQIHVCGFSRVYFACWGTSFFRCWMVSRSEEYIEAMLPLLAEFRGYLDRDEEPPRRSRRPMMPMVSVEMIE